MPSSTTPRSRIGFAGFVFDPANARLQHGSEVLSLRPKTVGLLTELAARPGELVDKADLMQAVWPEIAVTDSVLAGAVQELRRILGDDPRRPRFIETVHRRGYRFIAPLDGLATPAKPSAAPSLSIDDDAGLVGRSVELETLAQWLDAALAGQQVTGFVVGEAGVGKTTLVEAFCERAARVAPTLRIGIGHGLEWTSHTDTAADPYVPILEALGQASSGPGCEPMVTALRRYAPSWQALLPGVVESSDAASQGMAPRTTRERLALELSGFLAALPNPLLLLLEDLHWSDASTLDLLLAVSRRSLRAPLLILATYRAAGAAVRRHPVRAAHQTLSARGRSRDLWLKPFGAEDVKSCLEKRWPGIEDGVSRVVARAVLAKTDGNPLFVTSVIDTMDPARFAGTTPDRVEKVATELTAGIPLGVGQMIDAEMGRLQDDDRELLEIGALCGARFTAESIAAAREADVLAVETRLDALASSGGPIRQRSEEIWPDATVATMYEFVHALYGDVLRSRISAAGRRQAHRRIADRLHAAWKGREDDIAAELAYHFLAAGAPEEALPFVERASTAALRLGAHGEAASFLERGIEALETLPSTADRRRSVMRLCISLGQIRQAPDGFNAPQAEIAYAKALELAETLDNPVELLIPVLAMTTTHVAQGRLAEAAVEADRASALLARFPIPPIGFLADVIIAQLYHHTARLDEAMVLLDRALAFEGGPGLATYINFRIHALNYSSITLTHQGRPDAARTRTAEAMATAKDAGSVFDRASAAGFACFAAMIVRDRGTLETAGIEAETLGREYGFGLPGIIGIFSRGMLAEMDGDFAGGVATMMEAIQAYEKNGNVLVVPGMRTIVAAAHLARGDAAAARSLAMEARTGMERTGDLRFHAEVERIEAHAALLEGDRATARAGFETAIGIARTRRLRWQELRASSSLARLLQSEGEVAAARDALRPLVESMNEGTELPDLREARDLLASLAAA